MGGSQRMSGPVQRQSRPRLAFVNCEGLPLFATPAHNWALVLIRPEGTDKVSFTCRQVDFPSCWPDVGLILRLTRPPTARLRKRLLQALGLFLLPVPILHGLSGPQLT